MSTQFYDDQLQMAWPEQLLPTPPSVHLTPGYLMRTYHPGDNNSFFELMDMAGWNDWDEQRLQPWIPRILSEGWFLVFQQESGRMVASCMALRSESYSLGGELGWLASDPAHSGKGLGVGRQSVHKLFKKFQGSWRLRQIPENIPAVKFWRKVIGEFTHGNFNESQIDDLITQTFET